ncbi:MAG: GvpL/GvpF family gas vesicle protein [Pseudomonadota bacterium]
MIYLYALVELFEQPMAEGVFGAVGAPVQHAFLGDLTLLYREHEGGPVRPRRRDALAHTRANEAAMAVGTVLPMAFGTLADSVEAIEARCAARAAAVAAALERLRGRVEMGVRVQATERAALDAALGADPALAGLRAELAADPAPAQFAVAEFGRALQSAVATRRAAAEAELIAALRPVLADHVLKPPRNDTEVIRLEVLLENDGLETLKARLAAAIAALTFAGLAPDACQSTLLGPGPAFHFADLVLDAASAEDAA